MLTLAEALQWKKTALVQVNEFVAALQLWQNISKETALQQFKDLVHYGLPLHALVLYPETELPPDKTLQTVWGAILGKSLDAVESELDLTPSPEIQAILDLFANIHKSLPLSILSTNPRLSDLLVHREQAFHTFKAMGVAEPYPWVRISRDDGRSFHGMTAGRFTG